MRRARHALSALWSGRQVIYVKQNCFSCYKTFFFRGATGKHVGARALADLVVNRVKPLFHVFGHVHSDCGVKQLQACRTTFVNASCCSDFYHVGCRRAGHVIDVPVAAAAHPHDE